ncbi:MAG: rod shape-determining protein MreC [Crocinitomicaceae bacterium]|nr:rod shape-determining protein MreC [Crocinitomicaceae bacterium]
MQNLIAFFQRFKIFIVFSLLQFFALWGFFGLNSFPRAVAYNKTSLIFANLHQKQQKYLDYFQLQSINEKLLEENAMLLKKIEHLQSFVDTIQLEDQYASFNFIPAKVIHSTHDRQNNYLILDIGKKDGVVPKMGVITGNGVVGITYYSSENFTIVKSILTKNINLSVFIDGITAHGLLKYLELDPKHINLTGISNDIPLRRGLKILTRGSSGYFPKGLVIGQIDSIEEIEGKPLWNLKIRLGQDMRRVDHVYIITNKNQSELFEVLDSIEEI